ncbi:hypothetical protein ACFJIU_21265 [Mesorhizobium sp. UC74_2]|uniref:hypothetical protein n=2 Tax=unclassified Mesorhizobium TaxID=325217 RepID=UPI00366C1F22
MALLGWATLAWQADYGQFYLVDREDTSFLPPEIITPEMEARRFFVPEGGLVVYTEGSLHQHIRIHIHDAVPDAGALEPMSGKPWTQVETVTTRFPSRSFSISSPSMPDPLPCGPAFFLDGSTVSVRISWKEFQGSRDESVPVEPDVIEIALWPAEQRFTAADTAGSHRGTDQ